MSDWLLLWKWADNDPIIATHLSITVWNEVEINDGRKLLPHRVQLFMEELPAVGTQRLVVEAKRYRLRGVPPLGSTLLKYLQANRERY